jgi:hypothetical protein
MSEKQTKPVSPFIVCDCALVATMGNVLPAMNLRELLHRIQNCSPECLFHHFFETVLRPTFDDPEFKNDFAAWAGRVLRDRALAERLGAINPYECTDLERLRELTCDIIDTRLSELHTIPWAPQGQELQLMKAYTVVFVTGIKIESPKNLLEVVPKLTVSSIYYHFVEAYRREPIGMDDFSAWLSEYGEAYTRVIQELTTIDFYFLTLSQLKQELVQRLSRINIV